MRSGFATAIVLSLLSAVSPVNAQAPTSWLGTWKLNVAKSVYHPGPGPYVRATVHFEPHEGGIKAVYDFVKPRGETLHVEWIGKFDGQDYVVEGLDNPLTSAYTQLDDHTFRETSKSEGQITSITRITVSPDGKSMKMVPESSDEPISTVWEKQ